MKLPALGGEYDPRADGDWSAVAKLQEEVNSYLAGQEAAARQRRRRLPRAQGAPHPRARRRGSRSRCTTRAPDDEPHEDGQGGQAPAPWGAVTRLPVDELREHPLATLVPEMLQGEYAALVEDIRERGVQEPLQVIEGRVLDGRHRLRAAREVGLREVPVVVRTNLQGEKPSTFMRKAAVIRRHLTDDQRAMLAAFHAREHARPPGRPPSGQRTRGDVGPQSPDDRHPARTEAARLCGASPGRVKKALAVLHQDPNLAERVRGGELRLSQALSQARRGAQLKAIACARLPEGVFRTIVVDPPWRYDDASCYGAAEVQYPTMSIEEICALPMGERAASDAHLYLWITNSMLAEGWRVLEAWGFEQKTMLTWKKPRLGLGRYFRSQTEHVLFGVRGKLPLKAQDISNFFEAPQGRHSEKPEEFAALVERASPGPHLELFARRHRPGWTCWGAEVGAPVKEGSGIIGSTPEVKPDGADS